jgi:hypothetical protein
MLTALVRPCFVGLLLSTAMWAQEQVACLLATAKNGDTVTLKGEATHGAHDGLIRITGCADEVLLAYADDPSLRESKLSLKKDEMFGRFVEYFNAELPPQPNVACRECWKYRVTAEFTGRLDIAESAGWKKDAKTGKPIGVVGFGHPMPFTRYRLVITSVSKVEAVEKKQ